MEFTSTDHREWIRADVLQRRPASGACGDCPNFSSLDAGQASSATSPSSHLGAQAWTPV